jgi:glycosyltransferase involved in cell wall biosynthesis
VPFHDVEALAQTLQHVLEGRRAGAPEVLERMAEARWRAEHWFSVDRMVAGYEAVLRGGQRYDDALNFGVAEHASLAR